MNYQKIYNDLINKRKLTPPKNCYTERHHVIPVCMKGTNKKENLVPLTAREHYIAHALLVKIHRNDKRYYFKLLKAMTAMQNFWGKISVEGNLRKPNTSSRLYAIWKLELYQYIKENKHELYKNRKGRKQIFNNKTHNIKFLKINSIDEFIKNNPEWSKEKDNTWPVYQPTKNMFHIYNIETNEGMFISKYTDIPEGWLKGYASDSKLHIQQYNPSTGKIWITNTETNKSMLHDKNVSIPEGWVKGRIVQKLRKDPNNTKLNTNLHLSHEEKMAAFRERQRVRKEKYYTRQREKYLILLDDYYKLGFSGFLEKYPEYNRTKNNLYNYFRKYCKEEFEQYKINNQKHIDITQ